MSAILLFIENETQVYWVIIDQSGERITSVACNSLEELTEIIEDQKVIVLIPSKLVNQFMTYIPSHHHQKLMQAIPFAIENQIAENIDEVHFTYYEPKPKEQIVTVISQHELNELLNLLDEYQIRPDKIYPTFIALPYKETYWTLLVSEKEIILNISPYQGYVFTADDLYFLLEKLFKIHTAPEHFRVFLHTIFDTGPLIKLLQKYHVSHYIDDRTSSHPLQIYASNLQNFPETNILQTSYVSKHKLRMTKKYLLFASLLFCGSLFTMSLRAGLIYSDLMHKNILLKKEIQNYTRILFPNENVSQSNLKRKINYEFTVLDKQKNNALLNALKIVNNVKRSTGIKITGLSYQFSNLNLSIHTNDPDKIEKTMNSFSQYHLVAEQSKYETKGNDIFAELTMKIR